MLRGPPAGFEPIVVAGRELGFPVLPVSSEVVHAHHMLPWMFKDWFAAHGLDVNDPRFGAWVRQAVHQAPGELSHSRFNAAWEAFMQREVREGIEFTQEEILR